MYTDIMCGCGRYAGTTVEGSIQFEYYVSKSNTTNLIYFHAQYNFFLENNNEYNKWQTLIINMMPELLGFFCYF